MISREQHSRDPLQIYLAILAIFYVCHESRLVAGKHYTKVTKNTLKKYNLSYRHVYINFDMDHFCHDWVHRLNQDLLVSYTFRLEEVCKIK